MTTNQRITIPPASDGTRLDVFLLEHAPAGTTRGAVQRAIRSKRVQIAGKKVIKPSTIVRAGQQISVQREAWKREVSALHATSSMPLHLNILHEDPALIVLDKPAGVPVHAGVKREPSLADALLARYPALQGIVEEPARAGSPASLRSPVPPRGTLRAGEALRAGIVHRLDKDTSGVLLVARTPETYEHLQQQFQNRRVRKEYVALVHGVVPEEDGTVKLALVRSKRNPLRRTVAKPGEGGKDAETAFRVLERFHKHTLLAVFPRTGRMHQIRVHLAHLGFPVAGDTLYGRRSKHHTPPGLSRQFLHAKAITVTLPSGHTKTFESPLPDELTAVLDTLRAKAPSPSPKPLTYRWRTPRVARGETPRSRDG